MLVTPTPIAGISYVAGVGIEIVDPTIGLDSITQATLANAIPESQRNAPLGFAGLDAQTAINANLNVQVMTKSQVDAIIPPAGRLIVVSDVKDLRFGDGLSNGGFSTGINSDAMIYVPAVATTAIENGAAAQAAYNYAKTWMPYGNALSLNNRVTILLSAGVYDFSQNPLIMDASYIDVVGILQSGVRVTGSFTINETNLDHGLRNITFFGPVGQYITWRFPGDVPVTFNHENLFFDGTNANNVMLLSRIGGTTSTWNGRAKNVRTACQRLYSSNASVGPGHTINATFEDCEGGDRFIGIGTTLNRPIVAGTLRNCRYLGTIDNNFDMAATTRIERCEWNMRMRYAVSGARITYTRFKPTAAQASIDGLSAAQSVYIGHCELSLTGLGANIGTNLAGATPAAACNVLSDG